MESVYISDIAGSLSEYKSRRVCLRGWVANKRTGKGLVFIVLRDGSGYCQCVINQESVNESDFEDAKRLGLESSLTLTGSIHADERQESGFELQVESIEILQTVADYPIAKKEHGPEFLLDKRHLWLRSKKQWALMRIRNRVVYAIHQFFQEDGFMQMDSPLFTANAAEGTTTLFETDFFGQPAYLAQTGQLYGEAMAMAHGRIYTFGPTFRAEKSKTRRHLAEFWMIEPEMAYYDNEMNMDLIEQFLKSVVGRVLEDCRQELKILGRDISMLENVQHTFPRMTYDRAVRIIRGEEEVGGKNSLLVLESDLKETQNQLSVNRAEIEERQAKIAAGGIKKGEVNWNRNKIDQLIAANKELEETERNIPQWLESARNFVHGADFGGSDETVLTRLFDCPVMVHRWPKDIKAFYMKRDPEDDNYVKGVDVLAPEGYGEIVGGAEREDDPKILEQRIHDHNLPMEAFEWYMDLRRFGSVPHAGFGLGLERIVCWISGIRHIREAIPFPRYFGRLTP